MEVVGRDRSESDGYELLDDHAARRSANQPVSQAARPSHSPDTAECRHTKQACLQDIAARVVKIDVDPVWRRCFHLVAEVLRFVVHSCVKPKLIHKPCAFLIRASDAHHTTAFDLCNLADDVADTASGGADYHSLARLRLANLEEAKVSLQAAAPAFLFYSCRN
jgi:hypothetical protein